MLVIYLGFHILAFRYEYTCDAENGFEEATGHRVNLVVLFFTMSGNEEEGKEEKGEDGMKRKKEDTCKKILVKKGHGRKKAQY